jgi:hypothetical protein
MLYIGAGLCESGNGNQTPRSLVRSHRGRNVFENRVLRRIFGPKRDEVTGE